MYHVVLNIRIVLESTDEARLKACSLRSFDMSAAWHHVL